MIEINLTHPNESNVKFSVTEFSDSQKLITFEDPMRLWMEPEATIKSRMSWNDIQLIIQAVQLLKDLKVQDITLDIPYLLGARSDRKFSKGSLNYLKKVIRPLFDMLDCDVKVMDPHSNVSEAVIDRFSKYDILDDLTYRARRRFEDRDQSIYLVAPDKGAVDRVESVVKKLAGSYEILECAKHRDVSTGKILSTTVPIEDLKGANCIILDDICDGGATFIGLAEALKKHNAGQIALCVSHGIFSRGFDTITPNINFFFTTNSVRDFTPEELNNESLYVKNVI